MHYKIFGIKRFNISFILYLFFINQSFATLTKQELAKIYQNPWITLALIIGEDIQIINPSDDYYTLNDSVQITHFRPPERFVYNFFNRVAEQVDYIFFQHDPRTYTSEMGPNYKLSFFILYFTDGSHIAFMPKRVLEEGPNRFANQMLHLMIATKSESTLSHSLPEVNHSTLERKVRDYSGLARGNYPKKTSEFHIQMLITIFETIIATVQSNPSLARKAQNGISLIFLGCAAGAECEGGRAMLNQRFHVPVTACGIDINPQLISTARTLFPHIPFHVKDASNAGKIIKECTSPDSKKLVITIAHGLIAHEVMTGTYPALQVLQQVAGSGLVDIFYAASFGMPLFNRYMVEASGWNMAITHVPYSKLHNGDMSSYEDEDYVRNQLYVMTPKSLDKQAELFIKHSNERNSNPAQPPTTLDLSMSSHPEKLFTHLKSDHKVRRVKTLDLSWSSVPDKEQREIFFEDLRSFGIKNIIISGFEPWFNDFESYIKSTNTFNIYKRKDGLYPSETPSIPPYLARILLKTPKFTEPYFTIPPQSFAGSSTTPVRTTERQRSKLTTDPLLKLLAPLAGTNPLVFDPVSNTITIGTQIHRHSASPSPLAIVNDSSDLHRSDSWEQELQCIIEKSSARSSVSHQDDEDVSVVLQVLDISSSSHVIDLLRYFIGTRHSQSITDIDLSSSSLPSNYIKPFINLLMGFPALRRIVCNGNENWYPSFVEMLPPSRHFQVSLEPMDSMSQIQNSLSKELTNSRPWTEDISSGYLANYLLPRYHRALLQLLTNHSVQLYDTPADGLCFFHAVGIQLQVSENNLRAALYNHLLFNSADIQAQFPQYSGDQFDILLAELLQGSWGDAGQAALVATIFQRRVILIYFHSLEGSVQVLELNPDGSSSTAITLPCNLSNQDIILVHNGLGHWLAGTTVQTEISQQSNINLLSVKDPLPPSTIWQTQTSEQIYSPIIFPKLLVLLVTTWFTKLRLSNQ